MNKTFLQALTLVFGVAFFSSSNAEINIHIIENAALNKSIAREIAPHFIGLDAARLGRHLSYKVADITRPHLSQRQPPRFSKIIEDAAKSNNLETKLVHAVIRVESNYNPHALSPKGALGLMQLMPATAKRYGVSDVSDPVQNINGGARYLKDLLAMFGNVRLALAAYNAGEKNVIRYGNHVPPFKETQTYVKNVMAYYQYDATK